MRACRRVAGFLGALVLGAAFYVNKPAYETLYVGLETTDLNQVSIALAEASIDFAVASDGTSIQVPVGMTGKARLLLVGAELCCAPR